MYNMKISLCYTLNRLNLLDFVNEGDTAISACFARNGRLLSSSPRGVSLFLCSASIVVYRGLPVIYLIPISVCGFTM